MEEGCGGAENNVRYHGCPPHQEVACVLEGKGYGEFVTLRVVISVMSIWIESDWTYALSTA